MPTTIDFGALPATDFFQYAEDGFTLSTLTGAPDSFTNGQAVVDEGTGPSLFIRYTNAPALLQRVGETSFGATSLKLEGFMWNGATPQGQPIPGFTAVKIDFIGYKNDGSTVTFSFTTDALQGFENVVMPAAFAGGLLALQWSATTGSGLSMTDDIVLQDNRAPSAVAYTGAAPAGTEFSGYLTGTDPDGQTVTFEAVGALPPGVLLDLDGKFVVQPVAGDSELQTGQSRVVTFQFRVSDGEAFSEARSFTFSVQGQTAAGLDLCDEATNHPDNVVGNTGNDTLCGGNQNDTLTGLRGDDLLHGDNGEDILYGNEGQDRLYGGNGKDLLQGGTGNDKLFGENSPDTLVGGAGADTLEGGNQADTFVFEGDAGNDVITDFDVKTDVLSFTFQVWAGDSSFAGVMSHAQQVGANTVFTFHDIDGGDSTITLLGVKMSSLKADDFLFSI